MANKSVSAETEVIEAIEEEVPSPEIVFLYPSGIENGSSFPVGEYIYFTMTGNLTLFGNDDTTFWLKMWFDDDMDFSTNYHEGYGTWSIHPSNTKNIALNQWHTLNADMIWSNGSTGELIYSSHSNITIFADPYFFDEPLSFEPINYPNNSIIPLANITSKERGSLPMFKATGWTTGEMSDIPFMDSNWDDIPIGRPVNAEYVWDDGDTWNNLTTKSDFYYEHNVFVMKGKDLQLSEGLHTLTVRIANDTHSENHTFVYTLTESIFDYDHWYFWSDAEEGDMFYLTGNRTIILQNHTSDGKDIIKEAIYNLNDGEGNHTLSGDRFRLPIWNSSYAGPRYISYWLKVENYTASGGSSFWGSSVWTPEFRLGYTYDHIIPQVNLDYPTNDTGKAGIIPLIWSLDTLNGGWWNYSDYRFNVYYETDILSPTLVKEEWSPITKYTHTVMWKESKWYYNSAFKMWQKSAPALFSFEFNLTEAVESIGMGARSVQDTSQIRFIIEETTTQATYNESAGFGASSYASVSSGEPIKSATSGWISAVFSAYSAVGQTTSTDISSDRTDMPPDGKSTTGAPVPFGTPLVIFIAIMVLSLTKRED